MAQAPSPPTDALPLGVVAKHTLNGPFEGYEMVVSRSGMRFFPGSSTPVHRHPGIVLA
jgi:hypothetical protein